MNVEIYFLQYVIDKLICIKINNLINRYDNNHLGGYVDMMYQYINPDEKGV